jgi:hypothetical protein
MPAETQEGLYTRAEMSTVHTIARTTSGSYKSLFPFFPLYYTTILGTSIVILHSYERRRNYRVGRAHIGDKLANGAPTASRRKSGGSSGEKIDKKLLI